MRVCRLELESKLQELERRRIDEEARIHTEREKMEDRLNAAKESKDTAEKEAIVLRYLHNSIQIVVVHCCSYQYRRSVLQIGLFQSMKILGVYVSPIRTF